MLQSTSEYEERNFDDIQRALDIEHTVKALEAQLCYDQHSPEEVARQILKAACKFYDADWCGLIQVDGLKANLHTNFKNRKKKRMRSRR